MPSSEVIADPRAVLKMPERSWPKDAIGNDLRKGQLIVFKAPHEGIICRVTEVVQAGVMHDAEGKPIALQGTVSVAFQMPYSQGGHFQQVLCLKEPEK
jgi:hypothetical protein